MLDFGIVDGHVHLWDPIRLRYPWLGGNELLNRAYLSEDYERAVGPIKVEKIVFMQAECEPSQYKEEVAFVSEEALRYPKLKGIVAWAPLEKGLEAEEELSELAQNPLVRGVRRIIQFEQDLEFCLKPDFIAGVKLLPKYGFTFDICIDWRHMKNTVKFVEKCPEVSFVLDHIGKPDIRVGMTEPWKSGLKDLSTFSNMICKVSSLATEADHKNWTPEQLRPYVDWVFTHFGFERTTFAGDWPVSAQAAAYPVCVNTLQDLLPGASDDQLYKLFRSNAESFYRV